MKTSARFLALFFILAFALAVPFWLAGARTDMELMPGLPLAALAAFCPALAAATVVCWKEGRSGVETLFRRSFDLQRITDARWYVPALLIMPAVMGLSYVTLQILGVPVPSLRIQPLPALALCLVFFMAALGEELGWSGFAIDPMQQRWGALVAAIALGVIWAIYHYIGLVQAHRSVAWIAWWSLYTVAGRVILVWLYNNTGRSVFVASLYHMMINVTWQLFPVQGSYLDPKVTGLILALVAVSAAYLWGTRTLAEFRYA